MGDLLLKCPLCCNKTFDTKISLSEHLANILSNLTCPICDNKWASLAHLIEHLNLDDCQPEYIVETLEEENNDSVENTPQNVNNSDYEKSFKNEYDSSESEQLQSGAVEEFKASINDTKINNKNDETSTETQSVEQEGAMEQYVFGSEEAEELGLDSAVVTKQNNDGTISLTAVKDLKTYWETVIAPSEGEVDPEELYSCNTCGVSFTSVIDHIQNYHNDQEVVVEEPFEEDDNGLIDSIQYSTLNSEEELAEKQEQPRRVITESGLLISNITESNEVIVSTSVKDAVDKQNYEQPKRLVQYIEFGESVVKNIKNYVDDKDGPYHKVVVKESVCDDGNKVKSYCCKSCHLNVTNLKDFKMYPCKALKYSCPHCPVTYENSKSLCAHMKVHKQGYKHANKLKPVDIIPKISMTVPVSYVCALCNTVFLTNKSLKLHKRMHDPIKSRPLEPPVETTDGSEVTMDKYKCEVCDKMIPQDFRTIHQNSHDSKELNCTICNKKFHSSEYLEMHMNVHQLDKVPVNKTYKSLPYSCLYCTRRFARPHEKVKHERIHTGEKPHSCEICGKSFRVSYCLTLHMRTHTGARPYCCKHCGKRFKAHSVYNHHLLTHSEVRAYKCPYCPKAFKTSVQLAGHKNSHTKPFSCQHCNRPFASLYAVRVHTETHLRQNNLKFSCSLCGASYARAFALKDHVKKVHQRDVDPNDLTPAGNVGKGEEWTIKGAVSEPDVEVQTLESKDLSQEITDLEMTSNELIIS